MAKNKRAAMRRELKERQKMTELASRERKNGNELSENIMAECYVRGKDEGMELACGIIFLALHEYYGFGTKRIMRLMECVGKESLKMDEAATKFNVDWYINQLREKCNITISR